VAAEVVDHRRDVGDEVRETVLLDARGLVAEVVATEVQGCDLVAARQRRDLMAPAVPEVRKSVQQYDEWTAAARHVMDPDPAAVGIVIAHQIEDVRSDGRRYAREQDYEHPHDPHVGAVARVDAPSRAVVYRPG